VVENRRGLGCQVYYLIPPGKGLLVKGVLCFACEGGNGAAPVVDGVPMNAGLLGGMGVGVAIGQ